MKTFFGITGSLIVLGVCVAVAPAARAQTAVFDFDAVATGTRTPLSLTSSGITANFTASAGTFVVQDASMFTAPFRGNALGSSASSQALIISLSQSVTSLSLDFGALLNGASFTVQLYSSSVPVGSQSFTTTASGTAYQGGATLSGTAFDTIQISSNSPAFSIDNLQVEATAAPEPGTAGLVTMGLLPTVGVVVCRRKR